MFPGIKYGCITAFPHLNHLVQTYKLNNAKNRKQQEQKISAFRDGEFFGVAKSSHTLVGASSRQLSFYSGAGET